VVGIVIYVRFIGVDKEQNVTRRVVDVKARLAFTQAGDARVIRRRNPAVMRAQAIGEGAVIITNLWYLHQTVAAANARSEVEVQRAPAYRAVDVWLTLPIRDLEAQRLVKCACLVGTFTQENRNHLFHKVRSQSLRLANLWKPGLSNFHCKGVV